MDFFSEIRKILILYIYWGYLQKLGFVLDAFA